MKKVAIFGSARTLSSRPLYKKTTEAASLLVKNGWVVATGGGPGLMEAANKGAKKVCEDGETVRDMVETVIPVLYTQKGNKIEATPLAQTRRIDTSV